MLLLVTLLLAGAVVFGGIVKRAVERGGNQHSVDRAAIAIASFPASVKAVFSALFGPPRFAAEPDGYDDAASATGGGRSLPADSQETGYLLLSRHDGDREIGVVELVRLHPWEVLHTWVPDAEQLTAILGRQYPPDRPPKAWVTQDGSLLYTSRYGDLTVMLDGCSAIRWTNTGLSFHHSIERDADGNYWVPYRLRRNMIRGEPRTDEDGLARISIKGEVLSVVSLADALIRAGHGHVLYSMYEESSDLMHMNEIQPVPQDGPWWRRGDLFVSLRSPSLVLLYRPSSDEIVWAQAGPWIHQHDVNVVSPHEISVFSNNAHKSGRAGAYAEVHVHDFASGHTRSPWRNALRRHKVFTDTGGRGTVLDGGDVFVEETERGRLLRVAEDGTLRWTYINRGSDGRRYRLGWSRYLDKETGAAVAGAVASLRCGSTSSGG